MRNALKNCARACEADAFARSLNEKEAEFLRFDWQLWARDDQLPPDAGPSGAPWTTWLVLGGRGSGKTRTGAEWVRGLALGRPPFAASPVGRIALVGETLGDARAVMVEGPSGLLAIHPSDERPAYNVSRRELVWPNGAVAQLYSADDPESLRGPQFGAAWADELAKWRYAERTWDMLQFCLRLGHQPRQIVTTTPRPVPILKRLLAEPATALSRASTRANAANLAPGFLTTVTARYHGTRLGRQELEGELLEDRDDALWRRDVIDRLRMDTAPPLVRIVVAVDPPVTSGSRADACGIVAAGRAADGRAYILADATLQGRKPLDWARAAVRLYDSLDADCVVAEVNQGGELVAEMLRQVSPALPLRMVRATRGKYLRAEPVAALYEQGQVHHIGAWPELEDQMCDFAPGGMSSAESPDRVDALVWALTELMLEQKPEPRIRSVGTAGAICSEVAPSPKPRPRAPPTRHRPPGNPAPGVADFSLRADWFCAVAPLANFVVEARADDIHLGVEVVADLERRIRRDRVGSSRLGAEIHVQILGLERPVVVECPFEAAAKHPACPRVAEISRILPPPPSAGRAKIRVGVAFDLAECQTARRVQQHTRVPSSYARTKPCGSKPIELLPDGDVIAT